jgi:hypothetical protein
MKSEPKAFASLSSGLLARKGAARPAMRPQGFGQAGAGLEDLGWNDMGFEAPKPAAMPLRDASHDAFGEEIAATPSRNPLAGLTPVQSPVHTQQAEIADRLVASSDEEIEEEIDETAELYEPEQQAEDAAPEAGEVEEEPQLVAEAFSAPVIHPAPVEFTPAPVTSAPRRQAKPRSAPGSKGKAAFTLRLDPDRHLKLRLACAISGRSAQQLVTDALDALLGGMPELEVMAAKANRKG